jgi:hypothetical protein
LPSLRSRISENEARRCSVPRCTEPRVNVSPFCDRHRSRARRWGHPEGRRIPFDLLRHRRRRVARFLARHAEEPVIREAVADLDALIAGRSGLKLRSGPRKNAPTPLAIERHLARLRHGDDDHRGRGPLTGREALERILAVWLLSEEADFLLPDDARLTVAIGRAVVHARPVAQRISELADGRRRLASEHVEGSVYRALGKYLRRRLARVMTFAIMEGKLLKPRSDAA